VAAMIVQGALIGRAVTRFGERACLIAGLLFGIAGFSQFGLAPNGFVFWLGIPLMALWGFASSSALALMSRRVGASEQGRLQGANASIMGIANMLGPGLFSQTFAFAIGNGHGWDLPGAPFLLSALLLAAGLLVAWRATRSP